MGWELFRRDSPDGIDMVGIDGDLLADAPVHSLPLACEITIDAASAAPDALGRTEAAIEAVTARLGGRLASTARARTRLRTLVYLPNDRETVRFAEIPLPSGASITVAPTNDPEWTLFDRARPVDREVQSMEDLQVMSQLHAAGDTGGTRMIEHVVTGLTDETVDAFTIAVSTLFDAVDVAGSGSDPEHWTVRHHGDPAHITDDTWTIRLIAQRHGAAYDGWGCEVVRPAPTRRWFRRS